MASASAARDNQLRKLANAIQIVAGTVNSENPHIRITEFLAACRLFLITKLGFDPSFRVVDEEVKSKANELAQRTNIDDTIQSVLEREIAQGTAGNGDSASINIVRFKRVIEAASVIIDQILSHNGISFPEAIEAAYGQVFAQYHGPSSRATFTCFKPLFPTLPSMLTRLNEDENSVEETFKEYVAASRVVVNYIETIYNSNQASAKLLQLI